MVRAAAKNHERVTVVVDPLDYGAVLAELDRGGGGVSAETRRRLATKAFAHTAQYDAAVASYLARAARTVGAASSPTCSRCSSASGSTCATARTRTSRRRSTSPPTAQGASLGSASQLQGKELSFNNLADADTAFECVRQFAAPACVIVKHANPCGVAVGAEHRRGLRPRVPHRPDLRVRRHHRLQPAARRRDGRAPSSSASSSR